MVLASALRVTVTPVAPPAFGDTKWPVAFAEVPLLNCNVTLNGLPVFSTKTCAAGPPNCTWIGASQLKSTVARVLGALITSGLAGSRPAQSLGGGGGGGGGPAGSFAGGYAFCTRVRNAAGNQRPACGAPAIAPVLYALL